MKKVIIGVAAVTVLALSGIIAAVTITNNRKYAEVK